MASTPRFLMMMGKRFVSSPQRILTVLSAAASMLAAPLHAQTAMGARSSGTRDSVPPVRPAGHPSADTTQAIVSLLATINRDEVAAGRLAASRASRADVRAYAQRMVTEHSNALDSLKANAEAGSWVVKDSLGRDPAKSKTADSGGVAEMSMPSNKLSLVEAKLHSDSNEEMKMLTAASGSAFDKTYIDSEIKGHKAVLDAITGQSTGNEKLQTRITKTQKEVENHLGEARKLQTAMGSGGVQSPQ